MANVSECKVGGLPDYCGGGAPTGLCFVEGLIARAATPTRAVLMHEYALIAGLVMILQFHLMPIVAYSFEKKALVRARELSTPGSFVRELVDAWEFIAPYAKRPIREIFGRSRRSNFARCLGRNIIILNIYYSKGFAIVEQTVLRSYEHHPLVGSVAFAFFETVIVNWLARQVQMRLMGPNDYNKASEEKAETVDSKFADLSVPCSMATFTFVGQFALFLFFVLELNGDGATHEACNMNVFHWLTAVIVTNVAGLGESGEGFDKTVWVSLSTRAQREEYSDVLRIYGKVRFFVHFWSRLFYACIINGFCREVLLCLAPVALSVVDRDDLVKDCLAIFFISKMDDIDPRNIGDVLKEWAKEVRADDDDDLEEEERKSMEPKEADAKSTLLQLPHTPRAGVDDKRSNLSPRSPSSPTPRSWREDPKQGAQIPKYGVHVIRNTSSSPRPPSSSPRFFEP